MTHLDKKEIYLNAQSEKANNLISQISFKTTVQQKIIDSFFVFVENNIFDISDPIHFFLRT